MARVVISGLGLGYTHDSRLESRFEAGQLFAINMMMRSSAGSPIAILEFLKM